MQTAEGTGRFTWTSAVCTSSSTASSYKKNPKFHWHPPPKKKLSFLLLLLLFLTGECCTDKGTTRDTKSSSHANFCSVINDLTKAKWTLSVWCHSCGAVERSGQAALESQRQGITVEHSSAHTHLPFTIMAVFPLFSCFKSNSSIVSPTFLWTN